VTFRWKSKRALPPPGQARSSGIIFVCHPQRMLSEISSDSERSLSA
jgi:hypothetical protein